MKKLFLISILWVLSAALQNSYAQTHPTFNHTTIYVTNMNKSANFYEKVMQFERIAEPFHDNRHIWLKIGEHSQLHIVEGAANVSPHDINIHLAFSVDSFEDFMKHLEQMKVKYDNWARTSKEPQIRPDGIKQTYFQDPDGYWLEVNDDKF